MIDINNLGDFAIQTLLIMGGTGAIFVGVYAYLVTKKKDEPKSTNYKNIATMAQNLSVCKPSSRKAVLEELYNSADWTLDEVDELKDVLEGMLNTKLYIDKPGDEPSKGLKTI